MIPKIIHQMWKDEAVPEKFRAWQESWRRHHPTWDYRFWTDATLDDFVAQHYPDFLGTFRAYPQGVMRADAARVLLLHRFGGLYADLDAECLKSFDRFCTENRIVLAEEPAANQASLLVSARRFRRVLCNAVMLSPAAHDFWPQVVAAMAHNAKASSVLDATGPFLLSGVGEGLGANQLLLLPPQSFYPLARDGSGDAKDALAVHHWAGTWIKGEASGPPAPPSRRARRRRLLHKFFAPRPWASPPILPAELPAGSRLQIIRTARAAPIEQAKARNREIAKGLGDADWILWLDDGLTCSDEVIAQLLAAKAPLVGPNVVESIGGPSLDEASYLCDWQVPDAIFWKFVKGGVYNPPRGLGRSYLSDFRYRQRQPLDSLGGRCLLVAAELHREGLLFPTRPYRFKLDAEGLSAQALEHGLTLIGLPNVELIA